MAQGESINLVSQHPKQSISGGHWGSVWKPIFMMCELVCSDGTFLGNGSPPIHLRKIPTQQNLLARKTARLAEP